MTYLEDLLMDAISGITPAQARQALEVLQRVEVITHASVERFERDAKLYQLRGSGLGCTILAARFSMPRECVFRAIREHAKRRRAVLLMAS